MAGSGADGCADGLSAEARRLQAAYPGSFGVVSTAAPESGLPAIKKFVVRNDTTCDYLHKVVREHLVKAPGFQMRGDWALQLRAGDAPLRSDSTAVVHLYEKHRAGDGFLHMTYSVQEHSRDVSDDTAAEPARAATSSSATQAAAAAADAPAAARAEAEAEAASASEVCSAGWTAEARKVRDKFPECVPVIVLMQLGSGERLRKKLAVPRRESGSLLRSKVSELIPASVKAEAKGIDLLLDGRAPLEDEMSLAELERCYCSADGFLYAHAAASRGSPAPAPAPLEEEPCNEEERKEEEEQECVTPQAMHLPDQDPDVVVDLSEARARSSDDSGSRGSASSSPSAAAASTTPSASSAGSPKGALRGPAASAGPGPDALKMLEKYPDRVPVLAERAPQSPDLPALARRNFLVPGHMACSEFKYILHRQVREAAGALAADRTLYLFVEGTSPKGSATMSDLFAKYRSEDGFLRILYGAENTLGAAL